MGTAVQALNMTLPLGSVDAYIQRAHAIPVLSQEEELELATRWHEEQDVEAARLLVMAHLRFVVRIARGYTGYGLPLGDLIQEGSIGLMKAVKRFDPNVGVRLVTFAVHWIKAEMHEYILRNWRIVKVATTKAQRKLFFNLRKSKKRLGWFKKAEVDAVAADLGVSTEEVLRMETRMNSAYDVSFDGSDNGIESANSGQISHYAPVHYLGCDQQDPAKIVEANDSAQQGKQQLHATLSDLDERSQDIIQHRWLAEKKTTLQALANKYQISVERVRQLEQAALLKMKTALAH